MRLSADSSSFFSFFFGNTTFTKAEKEFIPILNTRRKVIQTKKSLLTSKYLGAFTTYENIENIFTKWSITNKIFTAILVKKNQLLMTKDWNLDNLWLSNIDFVVSRKFWIVNKLSDCLKLLYPRIVENLRIIEVLENL